MSDNNDGRSVLHYQLSELLGFDDGVSDVVDHLLSIESSQDLQDYLEQLLGSSKDTQQFVENVARYQRGETLTAVSSTEHAPAPAPVPSEPPRRRAEPVPPTAPLTTAAAAPVSAPKTENKSIKQKKSDSSLPVPAPPATVKEPKSSPTSPLTDTNIVPKKKSKPVAARAPAPKGKPKVVCGCFGGLHRALTNCLHCGRISCAKEGYSFCPFCEHLVSKEDRRDLVSDEAWLLKEQMLQRDTVGGRTQSTAVLNDQGDYYQSRAWSSADEAAAADEREADRHNQLHQRQKMQLNVAL